MNLPTNPSVISISLSMLMDLKGEDPDYVGQRMNSAVYQAISSQGLLSQCPDSCAVVKSHNFRLMVLDGGQEIPEFELGLLAGGDIGAGDAMALYDLPDTAQEGFAAGWNRRHKLAAIQQAANYRQKGAEVSDLASKLRAGSLTSAEMVQVSAMLDALAALITAPREADANCTDDGDARPFRLAVTPYHEHTGELPSQAVQEPAPGGGS